VLKTHGLALAKHTLLAWGSRSKETWVFGGLSQMDLLRDTTVLHITSIRFLSSSDPSDKRSATSFSTSSNDVRQDVVDEFSYADRFSVKVRPANTRSETVNDYFKRLRLRVAQDRAYFTDSKYLKKFGYHISVRKLSGKGIECMNKGGEDRWWFQNSIPLHRHIGMLLIVQRLEDVFTVTLWEFCYEMKL
jgi:hypothetical protein